MTPSPTVFNERKKRKMILKILNVETNLGDPTNCYIVEDEETKETMIIDPGNMPDTLTRNVGCNEC